MLADGNQAEEYHWMNSIDMESYLWVFNDNMAYMAGGSELKSKKHGTNVFFSHRWYSVVKCLQDSIIVSIFDVAK